MGYRYLPVGNFYLQDGKCEWRVWAPFQSSVEVVLSANNKNSRLTMQKDERGYWHTSSASVAPGMSYTYLLDDQQEYPDPASISQPDGVDGKSEIIDRRFQWTDDNWKGISLGEMIIYELHTGTFTEQGTFEAMIDKLDYLQDLGVNTIEIMPVAQFPGTRNWGYDGVFPFAVQHSYGGVNGLKKLVNAAHQKNIAVILDVVYNHIGPEGNILPQFGPYFTEKYKTPWGAAMNYDDAWSFGVRQFIQQNADMWLGEFHIDGLRLDAVHAIYDNSARHIVAEIKRNARTIERKSGKKKVVIAEIDLNDPRHINPVAQGGNGLDGQWIDEFHHAIHTLITRELNGYYEDFGEMHHLEKAFRDTYVYSGQYSIHRKKDFGVPVHNPYSQFVVFAQNHDQIGNRMLGDRLSTQLSFEQSKLVAATVLLSPYTPLLFMGEEYGEKRPFQFFSNHSGKEMIEMVRKGRKEEFKAFGWDREPPDPFSIDTFNQCKVQLNPAADDESATLFRFYQFLISLRKTHPAMLAKERESMLVLPIQQEKVFSFKRIDHGSELLIILNFSDKNENYTSLHFSGAQILNSATTGWKGTEQGDDLDISTGLTIQVPAYAVMIFEKK